VATDMAALLLLYFSLAMVQAGPRVCGVRGHATGPPLTLPSSSFYDSTFSPGERGPGRRFPCQLKQGQMALQLCSPAHRKPRLSRGINCSPDSLTNLDTAFSPPRFSPAFPAFPPHSGRLSNQVKSERTCGLDRVPPGPTIAAPPCVYAHLHTGLACFTGVSLHRLLTCDL